MPTIQHILYLSVSIKLILIENLCVIWNCGRRPLFEWYNTATLVLWCSSSMRTCAGYIYQFRFIYPWAACQIRKIPGCACAGNAGNVPPRHRFQRKPLVSDHGTCVTHVPWCMLGLLTFGGGENVPGIPGACANRNFTYLARGPLITIGIMCIMCILCNKSNHAVICCLLLFPRMTAIYCVTM